MSKSEVVKSTNRNYSRTSYYTYIEFQIFDEYLGADFKFDTGSAYTIFGFDLIDNDNLIKDIKTNGKKLKNAFSASGSEIDIIQYRVKNFILTEDIVFDDIVIYFSEVIGDRAILGFDILGLLAHSYELETDLVGTYYFINYEEYLKRFIKQRLRLGYYYPRDIGLVDDDIKDTAAAFRSLLSGD